MSVPQDAIDRRTLVKERHRRAIVDAAAVLMDETGGTTFTVDQLAARADVSRRTVFNHFASVDDIVITVCGEILGDSTICGEIIGDILDQFELGNGPQGTGSLFDEVAGILRAADFVKPMAYLTRIFGGDDPTWSPRLALLLFRAITDM
ncbi:MAG: TetR/AcrR family transcriptional regulator, partial [Stackebrandtia sp.]